MTESSLRLCSMSMVSLEMRKQAPVPSQRLMEATASHEKSEGLVTLLELSSLKAGVCDVENARRR